MKDSSPLHPTFSWHLLLFMTFLVAGVVKADISFVEKSDDVGIPNDGTPTYGMSVGDLNGDGYLDLFFSNHARRHSIYQNNGNATFTDVIDTVDPERYWVGGATAGGHGFDDTHGASWIDFDNDGDEDLLVSTGLCCKPQFMVNTGGELLYRTDDWIDIEVNNTQPIPNDIDMGGRQPIWFDSDDDGLLEFTIVTLNTARWFANQGSEFAEDTAAEFVCANDQGAVLVDFTGDSTLDLLCLPAGGELRFAWDMATRPFAFRTTEVPEALSINDAIIGDFDGNLRNDLFLVRGGLRPADVAFSNDTVAGTGTLE
ncbi:MAG: VCBS repeat-containing protein, partial [Woeseia sp.]